MKESGGEETRLVFTGLNDKKTHEAMERAIRSLINGLHFILKQNPLGYVSKISWQNTAG
jgi:hypothetical protein